MKRLEVSGHDGDAATAEVQVKWYPLAKLISALAMYTSGLTGITFFL